MARRPVPFLDVGATYRELASDLDAAYRRVMESGWFLLGPELEAFEGEFAESVGARHAVGVGCGLDALVLSLRALGIGKGDQVVVPSNTYIATWIAVSAVGATPLPVEPDLSTYCIEPDAIELALTPRTRAVIPVHLFGLPADMDPILRLAERAGIAVIADAAQAHGATYRGKALGGMGHLVTWSFYPSKNLGAFADAGAVTTDDESLASRIRHLRNYGSERKYVNAERGVNSRLDELQAAFLRVKLAHLKIWNERRARIAASYSAGLAGAPIVLPAAAPHRASGWHLYVVRAADRDQLRAHLAAVGIHTGIHYPIPPHRQTAYADLASRIPPLPRAEALAAEVLSLPIGPHLKDGDVARVIEAVITHARGATVSTCG